MHAEDADVPVASSGVGVVPDLKLGRRRRLEGECAHVHVPDSEVSLRPALERRPVLRVLRWEQLCARHPGHHDLAVAAHLGAELVALGRLADGLLDLGHSGDVERSGLGGAYSKNRDRLDGTEEEEGAAQGPFAELSLAEAAGYVLEQAAD